MNDPILDKIAKLMEKALHAGTPPHEADTAMRMADALMLRHSIDAIQVDMARDNLHSAVRKASSPQLFEVELSDDYLYLDWDLRSTLSNVWATCVKHNYGRIASGTYRTRKVVAYPQDMDLINLMYTTVMMHLARRMDPKVDPSQSWEENMFNFKFAGKKWEDIHYRLREHPGYPYRGERWERRFGVKFTGIYAKQCEVRGIARNAGGNPTVWRESYLMGFGAGFSRQMDVARNQSMADDTHDNLPALIKSKQDQVDEAYYNLFPDERPHPDTCECDDCHFLKCHDQTCPRPRCAAWRTPVKAKGPGSRGGKVKSYVLSPEAYNAGRSAGAEAASARNSVSTTKLGELE